MSSNQRELIQLRKDMDRITEVLSSNPNFTFEKEVTIPEKYQDVTLSELTIEELTQLSEEMRQRSGGESAACAVLSW